MDGGCGCFTDGGYSKRPRNHDAPTSFWHSSPATDWAVVLARRQVLSFTGRVLEVSAFDADTAAELHTTLFGMPRSATAVMGEIPGVIVAQFVVVPEPSTAVYVFVLAIGLTTMAWWRKRRT